MFSILIFWDALWLHFWTQKAMQKRAMNRKNKQQRVSSDRLAHKTHSPPPSGTASVFPLHSGESASPHCTPGISRSSPHCTRGGTIGGCSSSHCTRGGTVLRGGRPPTALGEGSDLGK